MRAFAKERGRLSWKSAAADPHNQKRRELLARTLKDYFGLKEDPIELTPDGKSWLMTRFVLQNDT